MKLNIINIRDVITNSSTEVVCLYHEQDLQTIKNLVNAILAISGEYTFDDLFDISFEIDEGELESQIYADLDSLDEESMKKLASEYQGYYRDDFYYNRPIYTGIIVKAKSEKSEKAAQLIQQIDNIFTYDAYYNG